MREEKDALLLAKTMVEIGNGLGRKTMAVISDMNQPLGHAVGNSLEVIEAIETLKGKGPKDLMEISLELGSHMVYFAKKASSVEEAKEKLMQTIKDGSALMQLKKFVAAQNGDAGYVDDTEKFPKASIIEEINFEEEGYVAHIEAEEIGYAAMMLGGGRETKDSIIDLSVGFIVHKKIGDYIHKDESVATVYANSREKLDAAVKRFKAAYTLSDSHKEKVKFIKGIIS